MAWPRRWGDEVVAKVRRYLARGYTRAEVRAALARGGVFMSPWALVGVMRRNRLRIYRDWTRKEEQYVVWCRDRPIPVPYPEIAKTLNRTRWAVQFRAHRLLRRLYPHRAEPRQHRPGELTRAIRNMSVPGVSDSVIATVLGVKRCTVYQCRKRQGIPPNVPPNCGRIKVVPPVPPPGGRLPLPEFKLAVILYSAANHGIGMSDSEIGRLTGHSRNNVHSMKLTLGIHRKEDREIG